MKVGFIGYGNHASRLKSLIKLSKKDKIYRYHPYKLKPHTTNDLTYIFNCDVVFITSPNDTHFKYMLK